MVWLLLLMTIVPPVTYAFVEARYGMRAAIITAGGFGILITATLFVLMGEFDAVIAMDLGFLLGLGAVSLKLQNSQIFKLQPTIIGVLTAGYLAYFQFFSEPLLVRLLPSMAKMVPEQAAIFEDPGIRAFMAQFSGHLILLFLFHAGLVAFAALRMRSVYWAIARIAIYPLFFAAFFMELMLMGRLG